MENNNQCGNQSRDKEALKEAAESSTAYMAKQMIFFLLANVYILVTVYSTTDRQLLIADSKITLPILGVEIPIDGFYWLAPLIVLAFHYSYLFSLRIHSDRLEKWRKEGGNEKLNNIFLFNSVLIPNGNERKVKYQLKRFYASVIPYFLPLLSILYIQIKYSKYHGLPATIWHFVCLSVDVLLLAHFWQGIIHLPQKSPSEPQNPKQERHRLIRATARYIKKNWEMAFALGITSIALVNVFMVALLISPQGSMYRFIAKNLMGLPVLNNVLVPHLVLSDEKYPLVLSPPSDQVLYAYLLLETKTNPEAQRKPEGQDIRNPPAPSQSAVGPDSKDAETSTDFPENVDPRERAKTKAWIDHAKGLDLRGRDLQFANFSRNILAHADLKQARLQGANLDSAWLIGADFGDASLEFSSLRDAELSRVVLRNAKLSGADLSRAKLTKANFTNAEIEGSDLAFADLRGAVLFHAKLDGAILWNAQLQFANLEGAELPGAQLGNANLRFANLRKARLPGADLEGADLLGADIREAKLQGTYLNDANLVMVKIDEEPEKLFYGAYGKLRTCENKEKERESCQREWNQYEQRCLLFSNSENIMGTKRELRREKQEIEKRINDSENILDIVPAPLAETDTVGGREFHDEALTLECTRVTPSGGESKSTLRVKRHPDTGMQLIELKTLRTGEAECEEQKGSSQNDPKRTEKAGFRLVEDELVKAERWDAFVEMRRRLACEAERIYVAKGMLRQDILSDAEQEFMRREINEYMTSNCSRRLNLIKE